ncbi:hypothetical protein OESDEN_08095 [Oesophagostomum dentatum]|uniref:EB domain-containing protein n=1 Tax=Oesophagostomum dentatum TaxID=61180 RepID=A0A0B1T377_OESDE|nr:hypothetical protein OESDEN_08095 [Oesophagostomum dentatum]
MKVVLLILALVLYACADDPWACDAKGKCRPGLRCVDGRCVCKFSIH